MNSNKRLVLLDDYHIFQIIDFELVSEINEHTEMYIKMVIADEYPLADLQIIFMRKNVRIAMEDIADRSQEVIFCGYLKSMNMKKTDKEYVVTCRGISYTYLWEDVTKNRTFQNESIENIVGKIKKDVKKGDIIFDCDASKKEELLIQYEEDDWSYLKRISSILQEGIYVECRVDKPSIRIGRQERENDLSDGEFLFSGIEDSFYTSGAEQNGKLRADYAMICISSDKNLSIGQKVSYDGDIYYIYKKKMVFHEYDCYQKYYLGKRGIVSPDKTYNERLKGLSLTGEVLHTDGENLKIFFDIDEHQDVEKAKEIEWTPMSGNLMYCMPKVGTKVTVYFSGHDENTAKSVNCIRNGTDSTFEGFQNTQNRQLHTENDKFLKLYKNEIQFCTAQNRKCMTLGTDGIVVNADLGINMYAAENIEINGKTFTAQSHQPLSIVQTGSTINEESIQNPESTICIDAKQNFYSKKLVREEITGEREESEELDDGALETVSKGSLLLEIGLKALAGIAVVAAVAFTIATCGAGAAIVAGAVIGGVVAVATTAISDYNSGNSSPLVTYLTKGFAGAVSGAVCAWCCGALGVNAGADSFLMYLGKNGIAGGCSNTVNELLLCIDPNKDFSWDDMLNACRSGIYAGILGGAFQYGFSYIFSNALNSASKYGLFKYRDKLLISLQKKFPDGNLDYSNLTNFENGLLKRAFNANTNAEILKAMKNNPVKAWTVIQDALGSYDWTIPGTGVNSVSSTITIALAQAIYDSIMKESKKSKNKKVGQISIDSMSSPYKPSYGY